MKILFFIMMFSLCGGFLYLGIWLRKKLFLSLEVSTSPEYQNKTNHREVGRCEQQGKEKGCIFDEDDNNKTEDSDAAVVSKTFLAVQKIIPMENMMLRYEENFVKQIEHWLEVPTMDASREALLALTLLKENKGFVESHREMLINFENICFDKELSCYSSLSKGEASIYGTNNAIEIKKFILLRERDETLQENELLPSNKESIISFLKACITKNEDGICYIYNTPKDPDSDGMSVIYALARLLMSLGEKNSFFDLVPKDGIIKYMKACDNKGGGMNSKPSLNEASLSSTFFFLTLISHEFYGNVLNDLYMEYIERQRSNIFQFIINECYDEDTGGFRSSIGAIPSLGGVYYALRTLELLNYKTAEIAENTHKNILNDVSKFLENCYCSGGGFAFSSRKFPTYNVPSAHATKWATLINNKFLSNGLSVLTDDKIKDTNRFLHALYDQEKGGFWGFYVPDNIRNKTLKCPFIQYSSVH